MSALGSIPYDNLDHRVGSTGSIGGSISGRVIFCYGGIFNADHTFITVPGTPPLVELVLCRIGLSNHTYELSFLFEDALPEFHPSEEVIFSLGTTMLRKLIASGESYTLPKSILPHVVPTGITYAGINFLLDNDEGTAFWDARSGDPLLECAFTILDNQELGADQKSFDDFLAYIRNEVINCPTPLIKLYINRVVREFCRQTLVWREDLWTLDVVEDQKDYHLVLPSNAQLVVPLSVEVDGRRIEPMAEDSHRRNSEFNSYSYEVRNEILHLNFKPERDAAGGLCVRVALMPKEGTQKAHKIIVDKYRYEIASGVKSELMMMKDKNWSNASQGMYYAKEFHSAMSKTRFEAGMGHTRSNLRVRMIPAA